MGVSDSWNGALRGGPGLPTGEALQDTECEGVRTMKDNSMNGAKEELAGTDGQQEESRPEATMVGTWRSCDGYV